MMTPDQIRACLETVSRQASIPEAERRAYVAGAEWALANAPEIHPTTMRSEAEVRAEIARLKNKHTKEFGWTVYSISDLARVDALCWVLNEQETGR